MQTSPNRVRAMVSFSNSKDAAILGATNYDKTVVWNQNLTIMPALYNQMERVFDYSGISVGAPRFNHVMARSHPVLV